MGTSDWGAPVSFSTKISYSNVNEQAKLLASNGVAGDRLGYSIAIDSSGNTVIVGAYAADPLGYLQAGAAYVFVRVAGAWSQQAILIADDKANNDYFGYSVAISNDGNRAIIGASQDDSNRGAAYIFTRSGTTWSQEYKIVDANGASNFYFGCAVAMSGNGDRVVIGAYADNLGGTSSGAAAIYNRSVIGTWSLASKIQASDAAPSDLFGICVSISRDGSTVLVGAYLDDDQGTSSGSAYVFTEFNNNWTQQAKLLPNDGNVSDNFGRSLSLSGNGNIAVISSFLDDTSFSDAGSAYIFTRSGTTWSQYTKITPADPVLEHWFGGCVYINENGTMVALSANGDDSKGTNAGAVYIFTNQGGVWTQFAKVTASDTATVDYFGYSLAINTNGTTIAVGTVYDDDKGTNAGAAYIFA